jgi:hypothetical protein
MPCEFTFRMMADLIAKVVEYPVNESGAWNELSRESASG